MIRINEKLSLLFYFFLNRSPLALTFKKICLLNHRYTLHPFLLTRNLEENGAQLLPNSYKNPGKFSTSIVQHDYIFTGLVKAFVGREKERISFLSHVIISAQPSTAFLLFLLIYKIFVLTNILLQCFRGMDLEPSSGFQCRRALSTQTTSRNACYYSYKL